MSRFWTVLFLCCTIHSRVMTRTGNANTNTIKGTTIWLLSGKSGILWCWLTGVLERIGWSDMLTRLGKIGLSIIVLEISLWSDDCRSWSVVVASVANSMTQVTAYDRVYIFAWNKLWENQFKPSSLQCNNLLTTGISLWMITAWKSAGSFFKQWEIKLLKS